MYKWLVFILIFFSFLNANAIELYKKGKYKEAIKEFKKKNNLISKAYLAKIYFKLNEYKKSKKLIVELLNNKKVPNDVKNELKSYLLYINAMNKSTISYEFFINSNINVYKNSSLENSKLYLNTVGILNINFYKNDFSINLKGDAKNFKNLSQKIVDSKQDYNQFNFFGDVNYKYIGMFTKYQYLDYYNTSSKNYLYIIGAYGKYEFNHIGFKLGYVYEVSDIDKFARNEGLVGINLKFQKIKLNVYNYVGNNFYKVVVKNRIDLNKDKILINYKYYNISDKDIRLNSFKLNYLHQIYKYFGFNYEFSRKSYLTTDRYLDYYIGFGIYFNFKGVK